MRNMDGKPIKNPVAFCALHGFYLSQANLKARDCLNKRCYHLRRRRHPYWQQREERKRLRVERKHRISELVGRTVDR